jgi:hypothetical protein
MQRELEELGRAAAAREEELRWDRDVMGYGTALHTFM